MLSVSDTTRPPDVKATRTVPLVPRATLADMELVDHHAVASLLLSPTLACTLRPCIRPRASVPRHPVSRT